jgi:hypothetical protein
MKGEPLGFVEIGDRKAWKSPVWPSLDRHSEISFLTKENRVPKNEI